MSEAGFSKDDFSSVSNGKLLTMLAFYDFKKIYWKTFYRCAVYREIGSIFEIRKRNIFLGSQDPKGHVCVYFSQLAFLQVYQGKKGSSKYSLGMDLCQYGSTLNVSKN